MNEFTKAFITAILMFGLGVLALLFMIGIYLLGTKDGEQDLTNKLCRRYEYDFCEPIIVNITKYKLKELKQDD